MDAIQECSELVLETIPAIMTVIRMTVKKHHYLGLGLPQLRVLFYLNRFNGASLSSVAADLGYSLPSMSKHVEVLVEKDYVVRVESSTDRRCVTITLTEVGEKIMLEAKKLVGLRIREAIATLNDDDRTQIAEAMRTLQSLFQQTSHCS
ncbi:MAG: MarR family winged helix-turn-helix transcriptional regulator [Armatimonadetes bacterium]|nr:MarR family winged helix-turn-helix transcriptional regulator [Armatimonadota bacterium]